MAWAFGPKNQTQMNHHVPNQFPPASGNLKLRSLRDQNPIGVTALVWSVRRRRWRGQGPVTAYSRDLGANPDSALRKILGFSNNAALSAAFEKNSKKCQNRACQVGFDSYVRRPALRSADFFKEVDHFT
jgi:hypothetical protein